MISFIVACFNEEENIIPTIEEIKKTCKNCQINSYEILVVDDKSQGVVNDISQDDTIEKIEIIGDLPESEAVADQVSLWNAILDDK